MSIEQQALHQFHHNQCLWLARLATGEPHPRLPHPRLFSAQGALAVRTGDSAVIMLPDATTDNSRTAAHAALSWARQYPIHDALIWNMRPDPALDLELLAQGFGVGFEPWWMTRDLAAPIDTPKHTIRLATDADIAQLLNSQIPYVMPVQMESTRALVQASRQGEVSWLVAIDVDTVIGQAIVNLDGDHAGLFNVGVDGRYRHRGIGTSLTNAAMRIARDAGATTMNLNSTPMGEGVYKRTGFVRIGTGMTWSISGERTRTPVDQDMYNVPLAIGGGDLDAITPTNVPQWLPNGMTAQELAARFRQHEMLRHLITLGQTPEIIHLWDVGMREDALAAVDDVHARELPTGRQQARPLHLAVERGAGTLVLALIRAGADLNARDGEYRATPLDWAHACNKPTIARIIRQAGGE